MKIKIQPRLLLTCWALPLYIGYINYDGIINKTNIITTRALSIHLLCFEIVILWKK